MILSITELSQEPLHSQISRQIRARILAGDLSQGQRLDSARRLARAQRVSALSVERAYADLEAEGLLRQRGENRLEVAPVSEERRRDLAQRRLLETLRAQEFSLKELEVARDIQCRLLPPPAVAGTGFAVESRNEPARFMAGDFYDVIRHQDGSVGVVVADVSGKGVGPSLIMASVKATLPYVAAEHGVAGTLAELNRRLLKDLRQREFVALAYARLEPSSGQLELANAGLPEPYLLAEDGGCRSLGVPGDRMPLGMRADQRYQSRTVQLEPGERVLMITDGIPETRTGGDEPLGYTRLARILERSHRTGPAQLGPWLDSFLSTVLATSGSEIDDDWTALALERRAPEEDSRP